jgi:hypothetical protein
MKRQFLILIAIVLVAILTLSLRETRQTSKKAFEAFISQEKIIAEKEIELQKMKLMSVK